MTLCNACGQRKNLSKPIAARVEFRSLDGRDRPRAVTCSTVCTDCARSLGDAIRLNPGAMFQAMLDTAARIRVTAGAQGALL